jgi:hypothetical protein
VEARAHARVHGGTVQFSHQIAWNLPGAKMEATELREQLCGAIARRSLIMFEYGDLIRVVEPHRFGVNSAGHEMLSGWLRAGYSRSDPAGGWRNYLLSEVDALQVLDAPFAGPRPGYVANDPRMRDVFCQLTLSAADAPDEGLHIVRARVVNAPADKAQDVRVDDKNAPAHQSAEDVPTLKWAADRPDAAP